MPEDLHRHATLVDQRESPRPKTVRARHAASLLVWREAGASTEILMGMRGARHRFMPNRLVFPGGAVDRADLSAPSATGLSHRTETALHRNANAKLAHGSGRRRRARTAGGNRPVAWLAARAGWAGLSGARGHADRQSDSFQRSFLLHPCVARHRHSGRRRRTGQFALLRHGGGAGARPRGPDTADAGAIAHWLTLSEAERDARTPRPGAEGSRLAHGVMGTARVSVMAYDLQSGESDADAGRPIGADHRRDGRLAQPGRDRSRAARRPSSPTRALVALTGVLCVVGRRDHCSPAEI